MAPNLTKTTNTDKILRSSALLNPIPCREQEKKEKVERSKTNKRVVCFYQRGADFSQSNRILLVIPSSQSVNEESSTVHTSSQSVNEESSTVHTLNPSIEATDAELLRVYDDIVKDYPDLIIGRSCNELQSNLIMINHYVVFYHKKIQNHNLRHNIPDWN